MNPHAIFNLTRPEGRVFICPTSWGKAASLKAVLFSALVFMLFFSGCSASLPTAMPTASLAPTVQAPKTVMPAPVTTWPLTVTGANGHTVTLDAPAERIISLAPANTEILFAIGAGERVVADTTYCNYPYKAANLPKIGGFSADSISVESIVAMKPDLVLANGTDQDTVIKALEDARIRVLPIGASTFNDVYANIRLVGQVTGNEIEAEALVASMQARVANVQTKVAGIAQKDRPTVFWEVWDEPLMTAGPKTFIGQLINTAGGVNIFADLASDWPTISTEEVVKRQPMVIMGPDSHGDKLTVEQLMTRPGWNNLKAVQNYNVYLINGDISSRAGPRLVDALEVIARDLYPDLFK
jgi:iron complex transport system substrate-binding protein